MVMCLTEVPVSGIRLLLRIITHPVDNTLSPKERNENKEQWEASRGHWAICIMAVDGHLEMENDTQFSHFKVFSNSSGALKNFEEYLQVLLSSLCST